MMATLWSRRRHVVGTARLNPIGRQTLWDRAYAELRTALLAGRFAPGERIVLREIAAELGISQTPVRDAVNHLIAERVLERGPGGQGGGATVPVVRAHEFRQLVLMRGELEAQAAQAAATRVGDDDIDRLARHLREMRRLIDANRLDHYLDMHRRFHFDIYALSGMSVIEGVIENLWLRCGPVLTMVLPEYVPQLKTTDFHAAALTALRERDAVAAGLAVRRDITEAGAYIYHLLAAREATAAAGAAL